MKYAGTGECAGFTFNNKVDVTKIMVDDCISKMNIKVNIIEAIQNKMINVINYFE
jgi:hypothetical protein